MWTAIRDDFLVNVIFKVIFRLDRLYLNIRRRKVKFIFYDYHLKMVALRHLQPYL